MSGWAVLGIVLGCLAPLGTELGGNTGHLRLAEQCANQELPFFRANAIQEGHLQAIDEACDVHPRSRSAKRRLFTPFAALIL